MPRPSPQDIALTEQRVCATSLPCCWQAINSPSSPRRPGMALKSARPSHGQHQPLVCAWACTDICSFWCARAHAQHLLLPIFLKDLLTCDAASTIRARISGSRDSYAAAAAAACSPAIPAVFSRSASCASLSPSASAFRTMRSYASSATISPARGAAAGAAARSVDESRCRAERKTIFHLPLPPPVQTNGGGSGRSTRPTPPRSPYRKQTHTAQIKK